MPEPLDPVHLADEALVGLPEYAADATAEQLARIFELQKELGRLLDEAKDMLHGRGVGGKGGRAIRRRAARARIVRIRQAHARLSVYMLARKAA